MITQPLRGAGVGIKCCLLQGLQRSQSAVQPLQLTLRLLLRLAGVLQGLAQLLQTLDSLLFAHVQLFEGQVTGGEVFAQLENGRVFRVSGEQLALIGQTSLTLRQSLDALFQLLNTRLLNLRLALRLGRLLVEDVPLLLPVLHGGFGIFQRDG
ncbi:hypothetical protein ALP71_03018 [Pseudomonas coronafaciens pv. garcae]|nr:hypothetical protein ALP71_03018 [Pseudomonas coronafaciens pv. garcae]